MPHLCFYGDPEETEKDEQAAAERAVTQEELRGEGRSPVRRRCPLPGP